MASNTLNCWEFMKCGREPNGGCTDVLGVCPAAMDKTFDGINRGKNAGRICWAVAGTSCGGSIQGSFAEKRESCTTCPFYREVQEQEGQHNLHTKFLKFIHQASFFPKLRNMAYRHIKTGERFVVQGAVEENAYIIQKGSCLVIVEKDGQLHPVDHYGKGDIVGGLGILTGEPRRAHVEAETDMEVWVLSKDQFDNVTRENPEILEFLTEVVANRLDSRRPTAYRTIGKYIATDIIGRGGYSIVYKGVHEGLSIPVAIKMMRHDMALNPEFLKTFRNEAKTVANLNHPNIIRIYDIEDCYRTVFIITELVEGERLDVLIRRLNRIPPPLAIRYLEQICAGLSYAHAQGIIHRDVNPTNMMVLPGDHVKILDFGLACPCGIEAVDFTGTLAYMAPEQIRGDTVDPRTDVYALGMLAYQMVTGETPFPEDNPSVLEQMHLTRDISDPAGIVADLPDSIGRFIKTACCRNPEGRYGDMAETIEALRGIEITTERSREYPSVDRYHMTSLLLTYDGAQMLPLSRILETFRHEVKSLGVKLSVAEFKNG
jgi:hypothetical protein